MAVQVCIVGGGFQNKGAEAMLLTVAAAVERRFPRALILARVPRSDYAAARAEGILPLASDTAGLFQRAWSKVKTASLIADGTTLIDVSGFQFGDDWPAGMAERRAKTVQRFTRAGNQVFFMPQAWGPFGKPRLAQAVQRIVEDATLSYVRDRYSKWAVAGLVGAETPRVQFAHDLAWNFAGDDPEPARQRLREAGLSPGERLVVCVTPNMRVYERSDGVGPGNLHVKMLATMIRHLCLRHDAQVLILGHELRPAGASKPDDQFLGDLVLDAAGKSLPIAHVKGPLRAAEIKALIGQCDLLLSSRYHALIAALSQDIPVGVSGWSHKYTQLIEETGGGHTFSHTEGDDILFERLDRLVRDRHRLREQLQSRVPELKENSRAALEHVMDLIEAKTA